MLHPLPIIVGIDPGTTTAIAILDTEGRVLSVKSRKGMTRSELSRHATRFGKPVLVAGDRRPAPSAVERFAATFSARLVVPEESLSRREKNQLAGEFLKENGEARLNHHERDALASAIYAYNTIKPTMIRLRHKLKALGVSGSEDMENFVRTRIILHRDHVKRAIHKFRG